MYKKLKILGLFVGLLLSWCNNQAQTAITPLGGGVSSPAGNLSYTIGQIDASNAVEQGQASINEGVQQTYTVEELRVRTPEKDIKILVYPNPTMDGVFVEIPESEIGLHYTLLSSAGSILKSGTLNNVKQKIEMNAYPVATYVLRVMSKDGEYDFKIVRIK